MGVRRSDVGIGWLGAWVAVGFGVSVNYGKDGRKVGARGKCHWQWERAETRLPGESNGPVIRGPGLLVGYGTRAIAFGIYRLVTPAKAGVQRPQDEDNGCETADFRHWIPARQRRICDFRRYDGSRGAGPKCQSRNAIARATGSSQWRFGDWLGKLRRGLSPKCDIWWWYVWKFG